MGVRGNRTSCKQGLGDMEVVVKNRDLWLVSKYVVDTI